MATKKPKTIAYRRKREKRTNYRTRLRMLLSRKPRIVARSTNQRIIVQLVVFEPQGDKILVGADSFALRKMGWQQSCKSIPAAYLTGVLLGKLALKAGHKEAIFDIGLQTPHAGGRIFAVLKGIVDAGMQIPYDEKVFPSEERINGAHIESYAQQIKDGAQQFTKSLKNAQATTKHVAAVKQKIEA